MYFRFPCKKYDSEVPLMVNFFFGVFNILTKDFRLQLEFITKLIFSV